METTLPSFSSTLRNCILNGELTEPVLFRQIHKSWLPITSLSLTEWGHLLDGTSQKSLSVRCGRKSSKSHPIQTQWESNCKHIKVSWDTLCGWDTEEKSIPEYEINSTDFWIYYDYKYMTELMKPSDLQKFEWTKLGFPERNGRDSTLWIGTSGSYTPCHFDTYGCNLVSQVVGKKKWILFPPSDSKFLRPTRIPYEESSVYSQINFTSPTSKDLIELRKCSPVQVTLEPGDVLFVPSKWWHLVRSETFSISINSWIELADDVHGRLEEAIVRTLISFVCNSVSPDSVSELLNPNEAEILDVCEDDVESLLKNSSQAVFASPTTTSSLHLNGPINSGVKRHRLNEEEHTKLPLKKLKQDSSGKKEEKMTKFDQLLKLFPCTMEKLNPFNFDTIAMEEPSSSNSNNDEDSKDTRGKELQSLINAIGHPDILKKISAQFLSNISQ